MTFESINLGFIVLGEMHVSFQFLFSLYTNVILEEPQPQPHSTEFLLMWKLHIPKIFPSLHIMITSMCNVYRYPLTAHFYIVKLGFTGVYIFLTFALKHTLWVLDEAVLTCSHNPYFEQK